MNRSIKRALGFVVGLLLFAGVPSVAFAFTQRTGDSIIVSEDVADDLYVFGSTIEVSGDIDGDLIVFGQSIVISGEVTGDLIAAGQSVRIRGPIGGSVRAAGEEVEIEGAVADDVVLAGNRVRVLPGGSIGRDAVLGAATLTLEGDVQRDVLAGAGSMTIASSVGGNVQADVDDLTVSESGRIGGDLTYYSGNAAQLDGEVAGQTQQRPARVRQGREPLGPGGRFLLAVLGWVRSLIGFAVFTVLALLAMRSSAARAADEVFTRPLASVAIGFGVLALVFPAAGLVFVIGIFTGGWWIAFVLLAVVWVLALVGITIGALALGGWLLAKMGQGDANPILAALLGVLVIWLIAAIPFVGWLVTFAAMLFGMGAVILVAYGRSSVAHGDTWAVPASMAPARRDEPAPPPSGGA